MTEFDLSEYAGVDPAAFAAMVKAADKDQIEAMLSGPQRAALLDTIFERIPGQFRADRAGSTSTVIRWNITDGPAGTDSYAVVIADGTCTVSREPALEEKVSLTLSGANFLQLIAGIANPMMLFMTGKVKISGDMATAAGLANLFEFPKG